jgi:hypothetical protein
MIDLWFLLDLQLLARLWSLNIARLKELAVKTAPAVALSK